ncbi:hypothetical protein [Halomarina pelagica]|uniref:hypothetical protein n=1 Tax=Halomarina pelagica TaxID=2961599 RepID=UPI0020C3C3BF|nr:hypothetical protein [Halomarina sp. BND7]
MPLSPSRIFEDRVREHLESRNFDEMRSNSGVDSFRSHIGPHSRVLLTDRAIWMLSLDELRELPKYLCDLTLKSAMAEFWEDHVQYWAWTGSMSALLRILYSRNKSYEQLTRLGTDILRDLNVLIQIALTMKRQELRVVASGGKLDKFDANPSYNAITIDSFRLVTRLGTSTLEGLLRRRCRQMGVDGVLHDLYSNGSEEFDVSEYAGGGKRVYIKGALKLWHEEEAEEATASALDSIRNFDQEKQETFRALFDEYAEEIESEMNNKSDFYEFIRCLRNPTAHSEFITHSLGSVFLNLCCLVFWDAFPIGFFEEYRENTLKMISNDVHHNAPFGHRPSDFYPVEIM